MLSVAASAATRATRNKRRFLRHLFRESLYKRSKAWSVSKAEADRPTAVLSLNQLTSSYLAYYSFLVYGAVVEEFNHYLVWTRLLAVLLLSAILFELWRDRRDRASMLVLAIVFAFNLFAIWPVFVAPHQMSALRELFQGLIVLLTIILGQGYIHQVFSIRRTRSTGAVSQRMYVLILMKDISGMVFGIAMSLRDGWPIILLNGVSAVTKGIVLWHFRWVKINSIVKQT